MFGTSALVVAVLAGCGGGHPKAVPPPTTTSALPLSPIAQDLQRYAEGSRDSQFVATYVAQTTGKQAATVGVYLQSATHYRVDVRQGTVTASLYATAQGSIACTRATGQVPACFLVAKPGRAIPTQFDAGVQRIFTRDLPRLAADPQAFDVTETAALPAAKGLAAARCFVVNAQPDNSALENSLVSDVDLGTYCLSESGAPRKLTFTSGTLTLSTELGAPAAAAFTLPAPVRPLPATSSTPPPTTTSATPVVPGQ
jgi:hypothetical protein